MDWVLRSAEIHSMFSNLGYVHADGYHVNENCNAALETILHNILTEDKCLRTYRRSISFGQNIKKDLIPLLINAKEDKTIELLTKILVNLTIPIECLLSIDVVSRSDFGRHTIFEINNLLGSTKAAFTDHRATKVLIDFLKINGDLEQKVNLSTEKCANVSNSLLLLRNILHIPEESCRRSPAYDGSTHTVQNQILWNIFSQNIDKILIKLMTVHDANNWGVTMVQLIALLYKDQHVVTLHKLLNLWLETSLSDSSEDNESNTTPPGRGGDDSSPIPTSDPTSDSSDTGASGKSNDEPKSADNVWEAEGSSDNNTGQNGNRPFHPSDKVMENTDQPMKFDNVYNEAASSCTSGIHSEQSGTSQHHGEKKTIISEASDCGYGTQIENQESISSSSNEDELPSKKPVHQKPHNPKQRVNNNKFRSSISSQDRKKKKIVKRGKLNIINVQGLIHATPTDDDISNVLKEFTVDFLLKGYNSLVQTLHSEILTNVQLEIDTSHFFWLVTYFLKFATQIELELDHVCSVLSFDIVSYLTAEGVNLCEQFELALKLDGSDLTPSIRRLHLVVTAIREFVQAIEMYKKFSHMNTRDQETLVKLQIKMCETEELRSLLVLLLRHYNPKYHSKQYLQDLIVTNHILLMFVDNVMKLPNYNCSNNIMVAHMRQFATQEIMYQYGLLLEDYLGNGEFVNDCIFTVMHHVGGDLDSLVTLFQPTILKTFTAIWKSDFEMCDDWNDLIEYVINTFVRNPHTLNSGVNFHLDDNAFPEKPAQQPKEINDDDVNMISIKSNASEVPNARWTEDEVSSLSWTYLQCNTMPDVIGEILKLLKEDGIIKSRDSVIMELFKQNLNNKKEFENLMKGESDRNMRTIQVNKEIHDNEIEKLCEQLAQDGKSPFLDWVQKVLLETCYTKIYLEKRNSEKESAADKSDSKLLDFELFKKKANEMPVMSPVSYHSLLVSKSVPLVSWNCKQAAICKDLKFLQLLHRLGFHMPVDSGKVFIRIPHFWTADFLYEIAGKISPIDTLFELDSDLITLKIGRQTPDGVFRPTAVLESQEPNSRVVDIYVEAKLKFSVDDLTESIVAEQTPESLILSPAFSNYYQIHKQKHLATMVNFTPMPGPSYSSDSSEINNHDWLKVVQKSQEYKITLKLSERLETDEAAQTDVVKKVSYEIEPKVLGLQVSSSELGAALPLSAAVAALKPTVIKSVKETSQYDEHFADPEYNNSVCETASVASDLTRMYVSDEDEKPEEDPRVAIVHAPPHDGTADSDSQCNGARKRPRVSFYPAI